LKLLLCFVIFALTAAYAQSSVLNPNMPKPGALAPELGFDHLLQASTGAKADWTSLHGKVVVLEFWATWCAPCIGEIPVLNSLVSSVDPAKVQFISVDDEDPAVVEAFLKKKPITGWIGIDTSRHVFERFGVESRPTTMVLGPDARVVSTTIRPEELKPSQLLALAEGKPVTLGGDVDPKVKAELEKATAEAIAEQTGTTKDSADALFEIKLAPGDPAIGGKRPDTHTMMFGPGQLDVTNGSIKILLHDSTGVPLSRITSGVDIPNTLYKLHVDAPDLDPKQLAQAIELAISTGCHVRIEHRAEAKDAYVLTANAGAQGHFTNTPGSGFASYKSQSQTLRALNATTDQIAGALEEVLGKPVVNETGLTGVLMLSLKMDSKDLASVNESLKSLGLMLAPGRRPVETIILSQSPAPTRK
jgi:thiol-disulfide isomerase/thioredoxin